MLFDTIVVLRDFLELGGWVLNLIFAAAAVLWFLLVERYLFLRLSFPKRLAAFKKQWVSRSNQTSWQAAKIRESRISLIHRELYQSLPTIKTLVAVCPLLGLLGTVTGMINVFEVMAVTGTGNARLMASGISMATIPTMAGMVVALSALFVVMRLELKLKKAKQQVTDALATDQQEVSHA